MRELNLSIVIKLLLYRFVVFFIQMTFVKPPLYADYHILQYLYINVKQMTLLGGNITIYMFTLD